MAWVNLGVAAIGVAGKVAVSQKANGGPGSSGSGAAPIMSGDIYSTVDHSGWVVNFGNGANVGGAGSGADNLPLLLIAAGALGFLLKKK